jgi:predicted nucleic acid-binding protein
MSVCFDTSLLIWGIRGEATSGQEAMIDRTKRYIAFLDAQKKQVMVPAPALFEYLIGSKNDHIRNDERSVIARRFRVPPLDIPSAQLAAQLQDSDNVRVLRQAGQVDKERLKIDTLIIAIAIVNSAEKIVSNDGNFKTIAQDRIPVVEVPLIPQQSDLF